MFTEFIFVMKKFLTYITVVLVAIFVLSATSIFLPKSSNANNNNTSISNTQVVDFSGLTYSALGDSITYGFTGDHSKPPFYNNYPNVVKSLVGFNKVNNYGQVGYLFSRHSNPAFKSMIDMVSTIDADSDVISVMGGINDFANYAQLGSLNSNDEYTIYGALNKICSDLKTKFPNAFVFFMTPLPLSADNLSTINNTSYSVADVCTAIKKVCNKYGILVLDTNSLGNFDTMSDSFDGCHPTELYYANELSPLIANFIKDNCKK